MLKRRYEENGQISDINVTPFVDVLLVLLIIFMITAPLFTKAIDIQLPKEDLRSSSVTDARQFVITINQNGKFYIKGRRHSAKKLLQASLEWKAAYPDKTAFIRADKRVKYGDITALMVLLKNNGIQKLGLLVEDKT